jgi:hypothetical protein
MIQHGLCLIEKTSRKGQGCMHDIQALIFSTARRMFIHSTAHTPISMMI